MARLRIGIDGFNLAMPHGTGVATYGMTLANVLRQGGHHVDGVFGIDAGHDPAMREVLFFDAVGRAPVEPSIEQRRRNARRRNRIALNPWLRLKADEVPLTARVEKAPLAGRLPEFDRLVTSPRMFEYAHRHFHYHGRFVPLKMKDPPAIMHWTYPVPIRLTGARNVYTFHDLVPLKLPYTTLDGKAAHRRLLAACIRYASHICTVSEASRADIIAEFGLDGEHVVNTYQASPPPIGWEANDPSTVERLFGLKPRGYFLSFGAIEPKKNLGRLLEAFLSLPTDTPLVLAGSRSWQSEGELHLLPQGAAAETERGRRIADRIVRFDHLPRPLLLRLIQGARAVLFPSIYEGFGLPILEAMQLGTPVLTSRLSSMPEIAGPAARYVDPYDAQDIARGIDDLDREEGLRTRLAEAGRTQAALFAPDRYLGRLESLYERVLAQPGR